MIDPAEALDALLEELKRQKAEGVRRVSVSDASLVALKALVGQPASAAPVASAVVVAGPQVFTLPAGTKSERMQALAQLIDACPETKKHLIDKHRPLLGHGSLGAKVVLVGEAPTLEEMESGKAFAGAAGEILQKILAAAGLTEAECYLLPLMVWRPEAPTVYGKRPPTARELAFNLPYLRAQIDIIQPKVVVALGAQAFQSLHGVTPSITNARGHWFDLGGVPLMATYHPNYLLHNSSNTVKRVFWEDFLLVLEKAGLPISEKQRGFFTAK